MLRRGRRRRRHSLPEGDDAPGCPELVGGEDVEWAAISNLDAFFSRIYRWGHF
jgi:hypothetical protein